MRICYVVSRRIPGSKRKRDIETKRGTVTVEGVKWNCDDGHAAMRAAIRADNPGWKLAMYAPSLRLKSEGGDVVGLIYAINTLRPVRVRPA